RLDSAILGRIGKHRPTYILERAGKDSSTRDWDWALKLDVWVHCPRRGSAGATLLLAWVQLICRNIFCPPRASANLNRLCRLATACSFALGFHKDTTPDLDSIDGSREMSPCVLKYGATFLTSASSMDSAWVLRLGSSRSKR